MGKTNIEWADFSFNPWTGCTPCSTGCQNCYASARNQRFKGESYKTGVPRVRTSEANWKLPLYWNRAAQKAGTRPRVFCASLADVFDEEAPDSWRDELFALIAQTPHLDWLLLTKRPREAARYLSVRLDGQYPEVDRVERGLRIARCAPDDRIAGIVAHQFLMNGVFENVWLGTSVENQTAANERIPELLRIPAKVHFVSCEPLLGEVDLTNCVQKSGLGEHHFNALECDVDDDDDEWQGRTISWVIAGGESGTNARPCSVAHLRELKAQCEGANVPFFLKQLGGVVDCKGEVAGDWLKGNNMEVRWDEKHQISRLILKDKKGGDFWEWPEELRVRELPAMEVSTP